MQVTTDNKHDDLEASSTSKESEIMNNEITNDEVIEIVSGSEITPGDVQSSQNQESIEDGITEDDAVSSPKEFQWEKYVFVAVMLIMVCCFFFKTENVSKQEKPDYEIKKSTIQYEAPAEIINSTLPKLEEKESITKSEKTTHKNTKAKKIDSKKVVTKADSEKVKKTKADSKKVKTESDSESVDIKTDTVEDEMLVKEIEERKTAAEEKYQQNNELEEQKKIEDEKREKEATRKKNWGKHGICSIVIGLLFISIWLILGYAACGYTRCQKNDWLKSLTRLGEYNYHHPNHPLNEMTPNRFFLWYDSCDLAIFVIGLLFIIFGLTALFYARN